MALGRGQARAARLEERAATSREDEDEDEDGDGAMIMMWRWCNEDVVLMMVMRIVMPWRKRGDEPR